MARATRNEGQTSRKGNNVTVRSVSDSLDLPLILLHLPHNGTLHLIWMNFVHVGYARAKGATDSDTDYETHMNTLLCAFAVVVVVVVVVPFGCVSVRSVSFRNRCVVGRSAYSKQYTARTYAQTGTKANLF